MAMKGYSTFSSALGLELHHLIILCHIQDTRWGGVMKSVYSSAPADWAIKMNQGGTQTNRPEEKEVNDDPQGVTSER